MRKMIIDLVVNVHFNIHFEIVMHKEILQN